MQVALKTLMVIHRLMRETEGTTFVQRLLEAGGGGAPPSYGTAGYGPGAVVPYTSGGPGGPTGYGSGGYGPTATGGAGGCAPVFANHALLYGLGDQQLTRQNYQRQS